MVWARGTARQQGVEEQPAAREAEQAARDGEDALVMVRVRVTGRGRGRGRGRVIGS